MSSTAIRIVNFIGNLHGMDWLREPMQERQRIAAIDVLSSTIYEAHPDFPAAGLLRAELCSGKCVSVDTRKLMDYLLLRHAHAMAVLNKSDAHTQYEKIFNQFMRKTGLILEF